MDDIDRSILRNLADDGRLTNSELARQIGLSATPTLRRVRALEKAKIISGYHAKIDPVALGRGFEVLASVNLELTGSSDIARFETAVSHIDEVLEAHRLYGEPDYLLRIAVADNVAYEALYTSRITTLPGVAKAWSQMVMKTVKTRSI